MEPKRHVKGKHLRTDWGHGVTEIRKLKETPAEPAPGARTEVDASGVSGVYANGAAVSHGETEFLLDFVFLPPGQARARVLSRLITSPRHAKRLARALAESLARYDARFGRRRPSGA